MKAAQFTGDGKIGIIEKDLPKIGNHGVLIKTAYCGLCGSERRIYQDGLSFIPGHEMSGVVVETGREVKDIESGQRAIIYFLDYCGQCKSCLEGNTHLCENRIGLLGWTQDGGYSEYVSVSPRMVYPIDMSIGLDIAILALDTIGTSFHALRKSGVKEKDNVLVIGCGPLGIGLIAVLKEHFHVSNVYAADLANYRLRLAQKFGAIPIRVDKERTEDSIKEQINIDIDVAVEIVGSSDTFLSALCLVKRNGKVVLLGEPAKAFHIERKAQWLLKDFQIIRSFYFPICEAADNIKFLRENQGILAPMITSVYPLGEIKKAFDTFFFGDSGKILINVS
jgi:threonine 3-dehydrogenase